MADAKNKSFLVKADLKADKRLTSVFLRMGVLDQEDVQARKSSLKDLEDQTSRLSMEKVSSSKVQD